MTKALIRKMIRGVSWKNPLVNVAVHSVDPLDYLVRRAKGRTFIPQYSIRIRSNGVRQDIGGEGFVRVGTRIANLLEIYAGLTADSNVLEIGCGCGRNAIGLASILRDGKYTGMDIERIALQAAQSNPLLQKKKFRFDFLDVRNAAYNPDGAQPATEYVLPYADRSFDIVFMSSVFTHMLTDEIRNYTREITRVLKSGGRCFTTAYLLDRPMSIAFPYHAQHHYFANQSVPEIAVAYQLEFLDSAFSAAGMTRVCGPLWGSVHQEPSTTELDQDLIVFSKN